MINRCPALLIALVVVGIVGGTQITKCKDSKLSPPNKDEVSITQCEAPPCKLRRKTEPGINMTFTAEKDVGEILTDVHAYIVGIPFPFIGIDGTSACSNIYSKDGKTKVGCPLKAGETYVYANRIKVLELYPKIKTTVRWALKDKKTNQEVTCFEVGVRIV